MKIKFKYKRMGKNPYFYPKLWSKYLKASCYNYALNRQKNKISFIGDSLKNRKTYKDSDSDILDTFYLEMDSWGYDVHLISTDVKTLDGYAKIYLQFDKRHFYHFLRQDNDGKWSHKYPNSLPIRFDELGRIISNPENMAEHDHGYCFLIRKRRWW